MNALSSVLAQNSGGGGGLASILLLVLPFGALIYMMIVPQRKQRAKHAQFVASLDVGDEVVTTGGIFGTISYIEDDVVHIEVDHDVVIKVALSSVARAASEPDPAARNAPTRAPKNKDADTSSDEDAVDLTDDVDAAETTEPKGK